MILLSTVIVLGLTLYSPVSAKKFGSEFWHLTMRPLPQVNLSIYNTTNITAAMKYPGLNLDIPAADVDRKLEMIKNMSYIDKPEHKKQFRMHSFGRFLMSMDNRLLRTKSETMNFEWVYYNNLTEYNKQKMVEAKLRLANKTLELWTRLRKYPVTDEWDDLLSGTMYYTYLKSIKELILPQQRLFRYREILSTMEAQYYTAKVCDYKNRRKCDLALNPDLTRIFSTSQDPEELKYYWNQWADATSRRSRERYKELVDITNEIARLNSYTDAPDMWINEFGQFSNLTSEVEKLWNDVRPLYEQLHAYVRSQLRRIYGSGVVPPNGSIPAHLLGEISTKTWTNIFHQTLPYPNTKPYNLTEGLIKRNYTPYLMVRLAERFYESLALGPMSGLFWDRSVFERINDRNMSCEPSAWDFSAQNDYRIRMCATTTFEDLVRIHHEMGHIQHFMCYRIQPLFFRMGSNDAMFEALPDLASLSLVTPNYLRRTGLIDVDAPYGREMQINQLYRTALEKIAILPFSYIQDRWRWDVFSKTIPIDKYNSHWWKLRLKYQGISPPNTRTEQHFDPGSMHSIIKNEPHIKYFMSIFYQFQYHRYFCNVSLSLPRNKVNLDQLHLCNIYDCKDCGHTMWKLMFNGRIRSWKLLALITIDEPWTESQSLMKYFSPLMKWLEEENKKNNEPVGWDYEPII